MTSQVITPDTPSAETGDVLPRLARLPLALIGSVVLAVMLIGSRNYGYFFDEAYFVVAGREHPAAGYFDQPPLVPLLAAGLDHLAHGNLVVLRLPATLAVVAITLLAGLLARELGGRTGAQAFAAAAVAMSLVSPVGHWLATYSLDPLWWTLIVYLLVRWVRTRQDRLLLLVGAVTALPDPDRARLARAEQTYSTLAVPLKALVVVDTSGSMNEKVGDTTRIGMLASGFTKVVTQIPEANAVGLWTFALATNGGKDWTEVVPTARLSDKRGPTTQRQALLDGVNSLPGRVRGGTGLYDTTLAAYRQAVKDFDPAYSNSLILLTDGGNEKNGGTTLDELVAELKKLVDPARPVNIHTVGISKDADLPALKKIADATGGTAQSADTEEQMLTDFVTAVAKRAK